LSLYEGKEIAFLVDKDKIVRGKIIRSGYVPHHSGMQRYGQNYTMRQHFYSSQASGGQPIIEVDGQLRFSLPGQPLFPALTDDSILKPTLHWVLESEHPGKLHAELAYVSGGMSWEASYNLASPEKNDQLDIVGWVTMDNQCGKTFADAHIKLMAGDVSKIQPGDQTNMRFKAFREMGDQLSAPPVSEKSFDEYHLYTLRRPVTLRDRETKQVEFIRVNGIKSTRLYLYDGAQIDYNRYRGYSSESIRNERDYGIKCNPKVWVMREIKNNEKNGLGIPLPAGRVRFYRQDDDGRLEFTGENMIDHTPKDETLRIYTGNAFDLVGSRVRTNYQLDSHRQWCDESFEITLRNRKEKDTVEVRVIERLYRWSNWEITEQSDPFRKIDSRTIEFQVQVAPGEEKKISYKVHYSW